MGRNVSGFVWHRLRDRGVAPGYGYPGDGVGRLDVALQRVIEALHHAQVQAVFGVMEEVCWNKEAPSLSITGHWNADRRRWDIHNLWVCDGSIFPTTGGVNPSLTITSIAMRTADRIKALAARGEL